jgi:hypothetical protein
MSCTVNSTIFAHDLSFLKLITENLHPCTLIYSLWTLITRVLLYGDITASRKSVNVDLDLTILWRGCSLILVCLPCPRTMQFLGAWFDDWNWTERSQSNPNRCVDHEVEFCDVKLICSTSNHITDLVQRQSFFSWVCIYTIPTLGVHWVAPFVITAHLLLKSKLIKVRWAPTHCRTLHGDYHYWGRLCGFGFWEDRPLLWY